MRSGHVAAAFHKKGGGVTVAQPEGGKGGGDLPTHGLDLQFFGPRQVGDTESTTDIDELKGDVEFFLDKFGKLKQHLGGMHHICMVELI